MPGKYVPPDTSPYALICPYHQRVFLTWEEYMHQLEMVDDKWVCPICMSLASFDDEWLDTHTAEVKDE